jgi:hypothetical protein
VIAWRALVKDGAVARLAPEFAARGKARAAGSDEGGWIMAWFSGGTDAAISAEADSSRRRGVLHDRVASWLLIAEHRTDGARPRIRPAA